MWVSETKNTIVTQLDLDEEQNLQQCKKYLSPMEVEAATRIS